MNDIKELTDKKTNSLEKYADMTIFQDKVEKANEALRTIGLPKK